MNNKSVIFTSQARRRTDYTPSLALASFITLFLQPTWLPEPPSMLLSLGESGDPTRWKQWRVIFPMLRDYFFHLQHLATLETIKSNPSVLLNLSLTTHPFEGSIVRCEERIKGIVQLLFLMFTLLASLGFLSTLTRPPREIFVRYFTRHIETRVNWK